MKHNSSVIIGDNLTIVPLDEAKDDVDFKSFVEASKKHMSDVQYLVFFKTESVHVGVNGNGLRFFESDLKGTKRPFMYTPVKYEHDGPIIGTVISGRYKKNTDGIGTIETKGVLWTLENTYTVAEVIERLVRYPEACKVSMECYYDSSEACDYGIGDKKISYNKFLKLASYIGKDYNGQGVVWQRANNPTFTGLAFTYNPADHKASAEIIDFGEAGLMQKAYASLIDEEVDICPNCGHILTNVENKEEGKAMRKKGKEELADDIDELEEEVEDEGEDESVEEETDESEADTDGESEETDTEEEDEEELEEEIVEEETEEEITEEEAQKPTRKVITRTIRVKPKTKVSKVKKSVPNKNALKIKEIDDRLSKIEEVYKAMKL